MRYIKYNSQAKHETIAQIIELKYPLLGKFLYHFGQNFDSVLVDNLKCMYRSILLQKSVEFCAAQVAL